MADILDIDKIAELGEIDIHNLKLILRELLNDIKSNEEKVEDSSVDISVILKLLYEKGFITKDEYEQLKDKINSLIDSDKIDDAYDDNVSDEVVEEIIKNSKFKGFFPTYEDLINKFPASKAIHGDYAYIKDFKADTYNVNNIEEFIYDINYRKWMSASDTTHLRNVYIREDEEDTGRLNGEPIDNDLLQYNEALKRWVCRTFEEADVARKSEFDFHRGNQIYLTEDIAKKNDGSQKDNGRLIVKLDTSTNNNEPMHINKNTFKQLLDEIDKDYYTKVEIETEVDELGVERLVVVGDDVDEYGNDIRRNITNKVIRKLITDIYDKTFSTFDIKKDPVSGRILNLNEEEPAKYVPHGINTYNVDKIISAIDRDYNNAFTLEDKKETEYANILRRVLTGYNELNITDDNSQPIIDRLLRLYSNKKLWDRYSGILEYEKNKNITPEVFNELIDLLHYLYISKDLVRDEILERDITINGIRTYTNDVHYVGEDKEFTGEFGSFKLTNRLAETLISSQTINFNNPNGLFKVLPQSEFSNDVVIKGNLTVKGTTTEVNTTDLNISDNVIVLNKGEISNGVSRVISGITIDRGTEKDLFFGYDEDRKRLIVGYNDEIANSDYIAMIPNEELDIKKPVVYNPQSKFLENSTMLRTDIDGATSFLVECPDNTFEVLDPVYFNGDNLEKCSFKSISTCEIIGVVGEVTGNIVKVVINGFIKTDKLSSVENGKVLLLNDGYLSPEITGLFKRKVAIKIPNGIIVDIQKNSDHETEDYLREQNIYKLLEPNTKEVQFGYDFLLKWNTKFFINGLLLIENKHYTIDKLRNTFVLKEPYSHPVELLVIKNFRFGADETDFITNEEIDNIFEGLEPLPPFPNAEYMENYEIDRIFGIMTEPTPPNPVMPITPEWVSNEQIDDLFQLREIYKTYNLKEQRLQRNVVVYNRYIHYFSKVKYLDVCDFVYLDNSGKINKLNFDSNNILGIVQEITEYDNGLIEYKINTEKIITYDLIPIKSYINKYGFDIQYGDKLYISDRVNKFKGNEICSFSNVAMFINYNKITKEIPTTKIKEERLIELKSNNYYSIDTEKMSINTIDLFEIDSPNFCKLNLINNSYLNEKNLYYELQLGKQLVEMYRSDDNFVIKPIRDIKCKTKLNIQEVKEENLIRI